MSFTAYLYVESATGGVIEGETLEEDVTQEPIKKSVSAMSRVHQIDHMISVPYDGNTGKQQGNPTHSPVSIVMEVDKSVPRLFKALAENELMKKVHVFFFKSGSGAEDKFHNNMTMTLDEARIVSMGMHKSSGGGLDLLLQLELVYRKVEWWDCDNSVGGDFDWLRKAGS